MLKIHTIRETKKPYNSVVALMKQNQIWYLVLLSSALVSSARTSVRDTDSSPHPLVSVSSGDRSTKCAAMAGQGRCSAVLVVALVVVSMAMAAQAADHVVGGAQGWTKPNGNSVSDSYLSTWAATQTFSVGDNLIFNYSAIVHSVLQVDSADYASCSTASPIARYTTGLDTVKLGAGTTYFICGTAGHCPAGQKVTITAAGTATPGASAPTKSAAAGDMAAGLLGSVAATWAMVVAFSLW